MSDQSPFGQLMARLRQGDDEAAQLVFERYARRLIGLAATRLPEWMRSKVDPEDVVQSVFRSFFSRQASGQLELDDWDGLWTMLTVITVRKCGHRLDQFRAARRDVRREVALAAAEDDSEPDWQAPDLSPTPTETLLFGETLEEVLATLKERDRPILVLRLQGYTVPEISAEIGRSERTIHRVLEGVRAHLERLRAESIAS
jgi:RNA polymerase sigma-70 factor (ECF subfamily)